MILTIAFILVPLCLALLVALHLLTQGRSSPLAALAFVLAGPALGVGLLIPPALKSASDRALPTFDYSGRAKLYKLDATEYWSGIVLLGCVAASAAATVVTVETADERQAFRDEEW